MLSCGAVTQMNLISVIFKRIERDTREVGFPHLMLEFILQRLNVLKLGHDVDVVLEMHLAAAYLLVFFTIFMVQAEQWEEAHVTQLGQVAAFALSLQDDLLDAARVHLDIVRVHSLELGVFLGAQLAVYVALGCRLFSLFHLASGSRSPLDVRLGHVQNLVIIVNERHLEVLHEEMFHLALRLDAQVLLYLRAAAAADVVAPALNLLLAQGQMQEERY